MKKIWAQNIACGLTYVSEKVSRKLRESHLSLHLSHLSQTFRTPFSELSQNLSRIKNSFLATFSDISRNVLSHETTYYHCIGPWQTPPEKLPTPRMIACPNNASEKPKPFLNNHPPNTRKNGTFLFLRLEKIRFLIHRG